MSSSGGTPCSLTLRAPPGPQTRCSAADPGALTTVSGLRAARGTPKPEHGRKSALCKRRMRHTLHLAPPGPRPHLRLGRYADPDPGLTSGDGR